MGYQLEFAAGSPAGLHAFVCNIAAAGEGWALRCFSAAPICVFPGDVRSLHYDGNPAVVRPGIRRAEAEGARSVPAIALSIIPVITGG